MTAFVRAVLFVALISATAQNLINNNVSTSSTSKPLTTENIEEHQGKSFIKATNKQDGTKTKNPQNKQTLEEELEKYPYFKLLQVNQTSRNKLNRDLNSITDFWEQRNGLADSEVQLLLGNWLPLDERELKANSIILSKKYQEYDRNIFPPSIHFFQAKPLIEESEIFSIIRKLPKGANLYSMLITSAGSDFMYQLTFENNLYFRFEERLKLKYSRERPAPGWRLLSFLRSTDDIEYIEDLNLAIKESLTFFAPGSIKNVDEKSAFSKIVDLVDIYNSLITYKPNFIKTFKEVLEVFYEDNIMYTELRYHFPELYDLDGKIYKPTETLLLCKNILNDFKRTHKDFIGARFIYAPFRNVRPPDFRKIMLSLWESNPDLMAGFGIIRLDGDKEPISYFAEELLKFPREIKFFLNVGLTKKWGLDSDYNLLGALILGTTRLGEAFALNKHPLVLERLRQEGVAVEFNPTADQVLNYVDDLRNHPHNLLVATNFPLVIGNSGGAFWNTTGLSYDWYEAYLAMTPRFCDIRCLKQFAINSWLYSASSVAEKKRNIIAWESKWNKFIDEVISSKYN